MPELESHSMTGITGASLPTEAPVGKPVSRTTKPMEDHPVFGRGKTKKTRKTGGHKGGHTGGRHTTTHSTRHTTTPRHRSAGHTTTHRARGGGHSHGHVSKTTRGRGHKPIPIHGLLDVPGKTTTWNHHHPVQGAQHSAATPPHRRLS